MHVLTRQFSCFSSFLHAALQLYRMYLQVSAVVSVCFYMKPCSYILCTYTLVQLFQFVLHAVLQLYRMYLHVTAAVSVCFTRSPAAVFQILTHKCSSFSLFYRQPLRCFVPKIGVYLLLTRQCSCFSWFTRNPAAVWCEHIKMFQFV